MADISDTGSPQKPQLVFSDPGGWISGSMASGFVRAGQVRAGDVLVHDGRELTVTADPVWTLYIENGVRVFGWVIATQDGSAQWFLYRHDSELVHRLAPGSSL
jgi:hypothetical protein